MFKKLIAPPKDNVTGELLNRVQDNVVEGFKVLEKFPFLNGILLENVVLSTGDNEMSHRLGKAPKGVIVVKSTGATSIYLKDSKIADRLMIVNSSADVTVNLFVF